MAAVAAAESLRKDVQEHITEHALQEHITEMACCAPICMRKDWARLENMAGPTHIGEVARGAGTPRSGGAAERRLDGIAYVARREQFL